MSITRRTALGALASAAAAATLPRRTRAGSRKSSTAEHHDAVLYDATRCIGCRECTVACAEANGGDPRLAMLDEPNLTPSLLTVLRRYELGDREAFRKIQCMHCVEPACVSGCMLGAMQKTAAGPVTWNADLCVGCRYCEIACPFNVPRFEWDTPLPDLRKCQLCPERRAAGLEPACVSACRRGALSFGTRGEMLAEAHRRIDGLPGTYNPKVYGEHDGGGTSWLYLAPAEVDFADLGLPDLGTEPAPSLAETVQHTLYKGFALPLALFTGLAVVVRRNTRKQKELHASHGSERSEPVGGRLLTWPFAILTVLAIAGLATVFWRFAAGLGATTNLNDGYAFGLWIAFDVVTGTALACGGYAVALLVYVANRGRYHPLVRAAIVTSALGYTLGGLSVLIDIGRAWNFYKIPLFLWQWNLNSILLEVAVCIMLYTGVLWIELSPAFLEKWRDHRIPGLRRLAVGLSPRLERAMPYLIALGLLLPTMHQSSLGSLMLLSGHKLHLLWRTPLLPLLFLVSCVAMGYAAVTLESTISARVFKRPKETPMLQALARPVAWVLFLYVALRLVDVLSRGGLAYLVEPDRYTLLFLVEMGLFAAPMVALYVTRRWANDLWLAAVAVGVIVAGALYRFSTYLIAYDPGDGWTYFPAVPEFMVTIGLVSIELIGYIVLVKRFPVLRGVAPEMHGEEPRRQDRPDVMGGGRLRPGLVGGIVLLLLAPSLAAQQPGGIDLRCLTQRPQDCLAQPVPADEPHRAVCATCHNLWTQRTFAEAVQSCTRSGCHAEPETLTPFHGTVSSAVLVDCTHCHAPHDARIRGGNMNCAACHSSGGDRVTFEGVASIPRRTSIAVPEASFSHVHHPALTCASCHGTGAAHRTVAPTRVDDCRSCHHTGKAAPTCETCHGAPDELPALTVLRRLNIRIGSLDRPERALRFDHARHAGVACETCHTGAPDRTAADLDCSGCHTVYHRPDADCSACHAPPSAGVHTREVHGRDCGGSGCHLDPDATILWAPESRSLCMSCHQNKEDHHVDRPCASCHLMPRVEGPPDTIAR